jgi:phage terminase large subunit GpA-like protein
VPGSRLSATLYMDKTLRVPIQNLDTDAAKTMVSAILARGEKGPGYCHFPCGPNEEDTRGFTLESMAEFTAEYRTKKVVSGYPVYSWHKYHGRPNHRLDCLVYALAGALLSHVRFDSAEPQRIPKAEVEAHMKKTSKKEQPGGATDAHKSPYGVQPGSEQLAIGDSMVRGFGVRGAEISGGSPFGAQLPKTDLWNP